ncbi:MAG: tetratricopeptide repeat protein [gamma proteobacterium symbiont of Bathyaustriella thionipta]|nr:tetratricopeptide repeat protein [gamma proteobacterium symbiont of Bathyaustriella thionipta]
MPFLGILLLAVQIAFAVHVVKTGRETFWIYIIMFVPAVGCAVYFFTQVMPDLGQSTTVRKAGRSLVKAIDPERELRRRKEELEIADTLENRLKLADECLEAGFADEAAELLQSCLRAGYEHDPDMLFKLAQAQFQQQQYTQVKQTLDELIEHNPRWKSADAHLLYARTLQALHKYEQAMEELKFH